MKLAKEKASGQWTTLDSWAGSVAKILAAPDRPQKANV